MFPVPDGDTGTNMSLTISCAIKELNKVEQDDIGQLGKALSKGSLMGARGNLRSYIISNNKRYS